MDIKAFKKRLKRMPYIEVKAIQYNLRWGHGGTYHQKMAPGARIVSWEKAQKYALNLVRRMLREDKNSSK